YRRSAQRVYSLFLLKSVQYGIIRSRGRQCKNGSDTVAPAKRTDAVQSAIARLHQAANWRLSVISACTETVRHSVAAAICVDLEHSANAVNSTLRRRSIQNTIQILHKSSGGKRAIMAGCAKMVQHGDGDSVRSNSEHCPRKAGQSSLTGRAIQIAVVTQNQFGLWVKSKWQATGYEAAKHTEIGSVGINFENCAELVRSRAPSVHRGTIKLAVPT